MPWSTLPALGSIRLIFNRPWRSPPFRSVLLRNFVFFVMELSTRSECLGKIVPLGERHLCSALSELIRHYHTERPHQGLGNRLIEPALEEAPGRA